MERNKERQCICLMLAVLLASLTLSVFAVTATAQEFKTEIQQPAAEPAQQQDVAQLDQAPAEQPSAPTPVQKRLKISWDNTLKYSTGFRVVGRDPELIDSTVNPSNGNLDDGDRAFHGGLISNRVDLLTEMDIQYGSFGIRASGAGWADSAYMGNSHNNSPGTYNAISVPYNKWTAGAREFVLGRAELLDAFAFGKVNLGQSTLSFRGGQYAMQWGESLFFGNNGIAGGMAPMDILKLLGVPNAQFKEIIRPVPQVSFQLQFNPKFAVGAYYQLGWRRTRLAPAGTYYSIADLLDDGAERMVVGPPAGPVPGWLREAFWRSKDMEPKDWGQFGVQVRMRPGRGWDLGFYGLQYHDRTAQLHLAPGRNVDMPAAGKIGEFFWVFPQNVKAFGVSATRSFGVFNFAGELSTRLNAPLVSDAATVLPIPGFTFDNNKNPLYATGQTVHGQVSWLATLGPSFIAKESSFLGEIAWNSVVSIDKNPAVIDPNTTKHAVGLRMVYEPMYRQKLPGMDISFPVGIAYFPMGKSQAIMSFGPDEGGDFNVGVNFSYLDSWRLGIAYTNYYGEAKSFLAPDTHYNMKQPLADRDTITFSIRRTFGLRYSGKNK